MIIRRRHTKNFTTISNVLFDDPHLQADEVGVLAYLLSRPDNWEIRRPALGRRWGIGPVSIKRIVRSWMRAGWCKATKIRLPNGTFCILYDISDIPDEGMTEEEVREALSLVSSEASQDDSEVISEPEHHPHVGDDPPPCQPLLADQRVVTGGVAYIEDITNTDLPSTENDQKSERELARAREKHALNLAEFKRRWPTAASDDQNKIDEAWFHLEFDEGEGALTGITPFLEKLKRDKRTTVPAGWKYLREKRWTLLEMTATAHAPPAGYALDSPEGKAIIVLHEFAGLTGYLRSVMIRNNAVNYLQPVTPRLLALANAPAKDAWPALSRQQAAAWDELVRDAVTVQIRRQLKEGDRAPWPWPPRKDGTLSATGPPEYPGGTEDDLADFK